MKRRVGVGGKLFTITNKKYRVKCDLCFGDEKVALALLRIIESFEVSAQRVVKNGKKLG